MDLFCKNEIGTQTVIYRNYKISLPNEFTKLSVADWPLHIIHAQYGPIKYLVDYTAVYRIHTNNNWHGRPYLERQHHFAEIWKFLSTFLENKFKPLAIRNLSLSYFTICSFHLKFGEDKEAWHYYKKFRETNKSAWNKNNIRLLTKLLLFKIGIYQLLHKTKV